MTKIIKKNNKKRSKIKNFKKKHIKNQIATPMII